MGAIIDLIMYFLGGVGVMSVADKYLPGKVPQYEPFNFGFNIKTVFFIVLGVSGAMLLIFISKKLGLRLFHRR
jgi:hypothetical protein